MPMKNDYDNLRRQHKTVHLIPKRCPLAIPRIASRHELNTYRHRRFTGGKRGKQGKNFVAPAASMNVNARAVRCTSLLPCSGKGIIHVDIRALVGDAII